MHDITTKYIHFETGAIYTFNEIVDNIDSDEVDREGYDTAFLTALGYINNGVFIEVER